MKPANAAIGTTLGAALIAAFAFSAAVPGAAQAGHAATPETRPFLHVIASESGPLHSCCIAWAERMREQGFRVLVERRAPDLLNAFKIAAGLTPETAACHSAMIEGYVIEGHTSAGDIHRLLHDRPEAVGLSTPGMPAGAPGLEGAGAASVYETFLIRHDGAVRPWAVHLAR